MTNDTPTLAQFAEALAAVKVRHPGAPGLPEGYEFKTYYPDGSTVIACGDSIVTFHAALALCVVTAWADAEWWIRQGQYRGVSIIPIATGWRLMMYDPETIDLEKDHPSLPPAALAMLVAIGGA